MFEKIFGAPNPKSELVSADLKVLNGIQKNLGDQAIEYVLTGNNETVLSTLSNCCTGNELSICGHVNRDNNTALMRREIFARDNPYDTDFFHRYTKVLAASCPNLPVYTLGSEKANRHARVFFTEAIAGLHLDLKNQVNRAIGKLKPIEKASS